MFMARPLTSGKVLEDKILSPPNAHSSNVLNCDPLKQDPQTLSAKGQRANVINFAGHWAPATSTQPLCCSMKAAKKNKETNMYDCMYSNAFCLWTLKSCFIQISHVTIYSSYNFSTIQRCKTILHFSLTLVFCRETLHAFSCSLHEVVFENHHQSIPFMQKHSRIIYEHILVG